MLIHQSHIVIASDDVLLITDFFGNLFDIKPNYENEMFSEFKTKLGNRIAFFKPVGKSAKYFSSNGNRSTHSIGLTAENVDKLYDRLKEMKATYAFETSGPPKEHPWGEKSFLLIDPQKNRWEITQSPSKEGLLTDVDYKK